MTRLDTLLDQAIAALPERVRDRVVVFGGTPPDEAAVAP
jgi:hypothetical protein